MRHFLSATFSTIIPTGLSIKNAKIVSAAIPLIYTLVCVYIDASAESISKTLEAISKSRFRCLLFIFGVVGISLLVFYLKTPAARMQAVARIRIQTNYISTHDAIFFSVIATWVTMFLGLISVEPLFYFFSSIFIWNHELPMGHAELLVRSSISIFIIAAFNVGFIWFSFQWAPKMDRTINSAIANQPVRARNRVYISLLWGAPLVGTVTKFLL